MKIQLENIPANACAMAGGRIELGDNGEKAKTAPIRLVARSGQPIEHWFWGRVVHDLSGMRTHKNRLPIDYAHNESEVLGYLSHFETESGDLVTSGALTPFTETDKASEVLFKLRAGVPYEASIYFGGDGIKLQDVAEGEQTPVNGYMFDGPGVVIREWPLRGVAICPYGADQNTSSAEFSNSKKFTASVWTEKKEASMIASDQPATVVKPVEPVATEQSQAVETVPVEVASEAKAVELVAVETAEPVEAAPEVPTEQVAVDPRAEFKRMVADFGNEVAAATFAAGGSYEDARTEHYTRIETELSALKERFKESLTSGTPASIVSTSGGKPKLTLTDICAAGTKKG